VMFRFPVDFPRPVETTIVSAQEPSRVTSRLLRFIEYDSGVNITVPQNVVWWPAWIYVNSVHTNIGSLIGLLQRNDGAEIRTLWRSFCPSTAGNFARVLMMGSNVDWMDDPTGYNNVYLSYRTLPSFPLLAGDELSFIDSGHALGDYVECHMVVNEVIA
jgi:hypothetical protein